MKGVIDMALTLKLLSEKYGVCRLDVWEGIPEWADKGEFYSITKTSDELSIVCRESNIPNNIKREGDWRILKVEGPLDFSLIGILSSISTLLAKEKISVFVISTYDTDYILIKEKEISKAVNLLLNERYNIIK